MEIDTPRDPSNGVAVQALLSFVVDPETAQYPRLVEALPGALESTLAGLGIVAADMRVELVNAEPSEITQSPEVAQSVLLTPTADLLPPGITKSEQTNRARIVNMLNRGDIRSVRDLLGLGKIKADDIRNLGERTIEKLEIALAGLGLEWKDEPTTSDLVQLYESPGVVPTAVAIGRVFYRIKTIQEILDIGPDDLTAQLPRYHPYGKEKTQAELVQEARDIFAEAKQFTERFSAAQNSAL